MISSHGFVVKAKKRQREPGRFVTLKSGRVIFIPEGKGTKWADVREKVLASQKGAAIRGKKLDAERWQDDTADQGNRRVSGWLSESHRKRGEWETQAIGLWTTATTEERSRLKAAVAKELSEATGIPRDKCSKFVERWAHSSNDDDMRSLAIQRDAAEEFGLELSDFTKEKIKSREETLRAQARVAAYKLTSGQVDRRFLPLLTPPVERMTMQEAEEHVMDYWRADDSFYPLMDSADQRKLLRAMYDATQRSLAVRGIKEVRVYRGAGFDNDLAPYFDAAYEKPVAIDTNVLESWSVGRGVAADFAQRAANTVAGVGIRFATTVPAERILSCPITGFGCLTEGEVVVLGGVKGDTAIVDEMWNPTEPWAEEEEELWAGEDY